MAYTYDYPMPSVTADCVVLTNTKTPKVLLIKRGSDPYKDCWALPGGYMEIDETTEDCAIRELKEETGIDINILYNVGTYSKVDRDPRGRVISIAYLTILESEVETTGQDDAVDAKWFDTDKLPDLAFDHDIIIKDAIRNFWHVIETEREVVNC
jgi:8-oxo-dGTP diphosphatase